MCRKIYSQKLSLTKKTQETFDTLITILTTENLNSWQPWLPDNHWVTLESICNSVFVALSPLLTYWHFYGDNVKCNNLSSGKSLSVEGGELKESLMRCCCTLVTFVKTFSPGLFTAASALPTIPKLSSVLFHFCPHPFLGSKNGKE